MLLSNFFCNLFFNNIKAFNKTSDDLELSLRLSDLDGEIKIGENRLKIPAADVFETTFFVVLSRSDIKSVSTPLVIELINGNQEIVTSVKTSFLGPNPYLSEQ